MDTKILEEIGLTKSEALVYLALTELGPSSTGKIVQKSGVASSKIYEILDKLELKGLVSHVIKTGVKEFEAAPPEMILDYINEKEVKIKREKQKAEKFVSILKSRMNLIGKVQEATIYRGMKGLRTVFYDCIKSMKPGDTVYVMGVPSRSPKVNRFFVMWNKFRAKHNIKFKIMFDESARGELQTLPENSPLSEIRFMPEGVVTPAGINISGENTIIFPAESEEDPLAILIRSKAIADSFRAQFELLWNQNVKTFYGLDGPRFVLKDMIRTGKTIWAFGLTEDKYHSTVPNEIKEFLREVEKRKIKELNIVIGRKSIKLSHLAKIKYLPERFSTPFHYEIYGNKVAIFYWIKPVITTVIENKEAADNFRRHFDEMWKIAKHQAI